MINDKNIWLKVIEAILFANCDLVDEKIEEGVEVIIEQWNNMSNIIQRYYNHK